MLDAGLDYTDVQQVFAAYVYGDSCSGHRAIYDVGMTGVPVFNVNSNCSSGASALYLARQAVSPSPLPLSLDALLPCSQNAPAIVRRDVGSPANDTLRPASTHAVARTRPRAPSKQKPPEISPARPPPSLPDLPLSSCRRSPL
jgi:hypothetical protein